MKKIAINSVVEYTVETFFFGIISIKRRGIVTAIDGDMAKVSSKTAPHSTLIKWVNISDLKITN